MAISIKSAGKSTVKARKRRHLRIRKRIVGTSDRPRLVVTRSARHIVAQLVDDSTGTTVVSASTLEADLRASADVKVDKAKVVGGLIAARAVAAGVTTVVFDRGGNLFHGRIAALAEAARKAGLEF